VTITGVKLLYKINASDYNTSSGVLRDEVACLTATESANPTIAADATPYGASVLVFNGNNSFDFTALGPRTQDETIFAVVKPGAGMASLADGRANIGGVDTDGSFEYRLIENAGHTALVQQLLDTGVVTEGESTNTVSTSVYSIIGVDWNEDSNVSNFYNDGTIDPATGQAADLASGPSRIGARQTGGSGTTEYFIGDIAEVDIYGNALSAGDSASIESQLAAEYLTHAIRTLTSIAVTPGSANLHEGSTQMFSAVAYEQYGQPLSTQPKFTWSVSGFGSINSSTGVYTAPAATGTAVITATSGSVSQSTTVTINHGVPTITTAASASPATVIPNNFNGAAIDTSFDNQPVTATDILLRYTYFGDTNLNSVVDGSDYSRIDAVYENNLWAGASAQLTGWFKGDLNYDGSVDGSDYTLMDNTFDMQHGLLPIGHGNDDALIASPSQSPIKKDDNPATDDASPSGKAGRGSMPTPGTFSTAARITFGDSTNPTAETKMRKRDVLDGLNFE
jgi:hypothetical protein